MLDKFSASVAGALMAFGVSAPALAAPMLVYVSGKGVDAGGCGILASPCRTFQFAHDAVAAGGYIVAIDPADFGRVNITKSVAIANESAGLAQARYDQPDSGAMQVNAGAADLVRLRNIMIDAQNPGTALFVNSVKHLEIVDCVIRNQIGWGFKRGYQAGGVAIFDTLFRNGATGTTDYPLKGFHSPRMSVIYLRDGWYRFVASLSEMPAADRFSARNSETFSDNIIRGNTYNAPGALH